MSEFMSRGGVIAYAVASHPATGQHVFTGVSFDGTPVPQLEGFCLGKDEPEQNWRQRLEFEVFDAIATALRVAA